MLMTRTATPSAESAIGPACGRLGWALALLVLILGLVPLAHTDPPDQTSIGGIYDEADYDDVVAALTSAVGVIEEAPPPARSVALGAVSLAAPDASILPSPPRLPSAGRAPPA